MSRAKAAAIVDLPSSGSAEVIPTILFDVLVTFKSTASLIERIDSAKRDSGISVAAQNTPDRRTMALGPKCVPAGCNSRGNGLGSTSFNRGTRDKQGMCNNVST